MSLEFKICAPPKPNMKIIAPWSIYGHGFEYHLYGKYPNFLWRIMAYMFFGIKYERLK